VAKELENSKYLPEEDAVQYTNVFASTMGLQCSHMFQDMISRNARLTLNDFHQIGGIQSLLMDTERQRNFFLTPSTHWYELRVPASSPATHN
jgi:hypothetical protein